MAALEGASPRPEKRADIAKKIAARQLAVRSYPSPVRENLRKRRRPHSLRPRVGRRPVPRPSQNRGDGAPSGASFTRNHVPFPARGASRRAIAAISVPGAVLPGGMTGTPFGSPHPGGFRPPFVFRHRPALSGRPSSWGRTVGRGLPGARRARPRPRAPHPSPPSRRLMRAPSVDRILRTIYL